MALPNATTLPPELARARAALLERRTTTAELDAQFVEAVLDARAAGFTQAQIAAACELTHAGVRKAVARGTRLARSA